MGKLEQGGQALVVQHIGRDAGDAQSLGRRENVRRKSTAQLKTVALDEILVGADRGELQRLVERGRYAAGFEIVEDEVHVQDDTLVRGRRQRETVIDAIKAFSSGRRHRISSSPGGNIHHA